MVVWRAPQAVVLYEEVSHTAPFLAVAGLAGLFLLAYLPWAAVRFGLAAEGSEERLLRLAAKHRCAE